MRLRHRSITIAVLAIVGLAAGTAVYAATTDVALNGGDSAHVTCLGSSLSRSVSSSTDWTVTCRTPSASPTSSSTNATATATTTISSAPATSSSPTVSAGMTVPTSTSGGWINQCHHSHYLADDPIVFPGQPGATHLHDFLGNGTIDAFSTYDSLIAASNPWNSTCAPNTADTAAYWFPAILENGQSGFTCISLNSSSPRCSLYYRQDDESLSYLQAHPTQPWPPGFAMVAGNSHATSVADNPKLGRELYYGCSNNSTGKLTAPVACSTGFGSIHIGFPRCWDGVSVPVGQDSSPHLRYPSSGSCPVGFQAGNFPRLIERIEYPIGDPAAVTLSSGPTYTLHGDFFNAWQPGALESLVARCLDTSVDCGNDPIP
jgi:hypothetical protein